ncbi:MAG: hypothetical protein H0W61_15625 [Bacteroidetes bacterium]|nr:hypothetical protein [Bacteroidota bacterium]
MKHVKYRVIALFVMFAVFIAFPIINNFAGFVKDIPSQENRARSKKPCFDINLLDPYPELYEKYYNDTFPIRSRIIKHFTDFNLHVYKKSPFPDKVVIGNDNWLFMAGGELEAYLGKNQLTKEQLEAYKLDMEFQKKYLEERGCKFYFMVTPTKANVHSEKMPYTYYRVNEQSVGEQLSEYLKKNSSISVISVFDEFKKIKESEHIYYKHDNHWNRKGAFYASQIIIKEIQKDFPNIKPLAINDFEVTKVVKEEGDIIRFVGSPDLGEDYEYEFISKKSGKPVPTNTLKYEITDDPAGPAVQTIHNSDTMRPKMMIMGDSFAGMLFPFLSESFSKSTRVFDNWRYKMWDEVVKAEKPDVYILMIYEPFVVYTPDNHSRFKK